MSLEKEIEDLKFQVSASALIISEHESKIEILKAENKNLLKQINITSKSSTEINNRPPLVSNVRGAGRKSRVDEGLVIQESGSYVLTYMYQAYVMDLRNNAIGRNLILNKNLTNHTYNSFRKIGGIIFNEKTTKYIYIFIHLLFIGDCILRYF